MMNQPAIGAVGKDRSSVPRMPFDMESLVGYILLIGVLSSIVLLVAGTAWHWVTKGTSEFTYTIQGMNLCGFILTTLRQLTAGRWYPETLIDLGISVLLLTPYVRVLASMLYFLVAERNWKYSLFTFFVLCVLTYTLFLR